MAVSKEKKKKKKKPKKKMKIQKITLVGVQQVSTNSETALILGSKLHRTST